MLASLLIMVLIQCSLVHDKKAGARFHRNVGNHPPDHRGHMFNISCHELQISHISIIVLRTGNLLGTLLKLSFGDSIHTIPEAFEMVYKCESF